ncbi:MAG TPA: hypothetical protein VFU12_17195 [Glycomyces sp.]|nr:hypothetical protein [Glycomyces sp.]
MLSSTTSVNSGVGSAAWNSSDSQALVRGLGHPSSFISRLISALVAHWMKYQAASACWAKGLMA